MTHTTITGVVLDLSALNEEEREFWDRALRAWWGGDSWASMMSLVRGDSNPLFRSSDAPFTHPLYRALQDLVIRTMIRQGVVG